jgi:hypothetical protein
MEIFCESFKDTKSFIKYIKTSTYLEYDIIGELISIPGVISEKGINMFIFDKKILYSTKKFGTENTKETYFLNCLNQENIFMFGQDRDMIILIKEDKYYFPIYKVKKEPKIDKKIIVKKIYTEDNEKSIINELRNYHSESCMSTLLNKIVTNVKLIAKNIIRYIDKSGKFKVVNQYIDNRHKCKYILLNNDLIIPVIPSGISYKYHFRNYYKTTK